VGQFDLFYGTAIYRRHRMNSPDAIKKPKPPQPGSPEWLPHVVRALEPHVNAIRIGIYVFAGIMFATTIVILVLVWRSL
jgi:hypothetical protein